MVSYIVRRMVFMLIVLVLVSIVSFIIIQLPPGDFVADLLDHLRWRVGYTFDDAFVERMYRQYGLDLPLYRQYLKWVFNMLRGDFGMSFAHRRPVSQLLAERMPYTILISVATLIFSYLMAIPIGIYSATHQYSIADYTATVIGFIGLAIPNFLLALALMIFFSRTLGLAIGGLFSPEYLDAAWSLGRVWDLLKHLPIPIIVVGTAGTAGLIRVMRGSLLDELGKQYVITARAKGVLEGKLIFKYPVRVAINPLVSTVGYSLPVIVSGETITSIVLGLPTTGPLLFNALLVEDMYLAGSTVMILSILVLVGTLVSDMLLVAVDPRIRFD